MKAVFEKRLFSNKAKIWIGHYDNLENVFHYHPEEEIAYIESGESVISINNVVYHGGCGDVFYIKGGDIHYMKASDGSRLKFIIFSSEIAKNICGKYALDSPVVKNSNDISDVYNSIYTELSRQREFYESKARVMLKNYLIDVFRQENHSKLSEIKENDNIIMYKRLIDYVGENFKTITFTDAANFMCLTPTYFSAVFSKLSGTTFTKYINRIKVENAIELLLYSHETITDAALDSGFENVRSFNRTFKGIYNITPTEYIIRNS